MFFSVSVSGSEEQATKSSALLSQYELPNPVVTESSFAGDTTPEHFNFLLTDETPTSSSHDVGSNDLIYHNIVTNPDGDDIVANADYGFEFPTNVQDSFDSPDYVLGQNAVDYGRGYAFGMAGDPWNSVTMVDGNLEPLEEEIPYFDESSPTKVTAAVGAPAHIPCMVRNLGSKSLSWIRHRDLHVLTVGSFTFANDHRFSAHRDQATGDWVLVLRKPEPSDSGQYVCSISTKPVMTHSVQLNVVVPSAEMVGGRDVFLDHGSTLNLTCLIHYSPSPPEFVLWYHRDKLVNYGGRGGRIEVETVHHDTTTRSSLLVRNATQWHSGRYSCQPANAQHVSILVHVLKSETPAAMQTTTSNACASADMSSLAAVLAAVFIITTFVGEAMKPYKRPEVERMNKYEFFSIELSLESASYNFEVQRLPKWPTRDYAHDSKMCESEIISMKNCN
ncbi:Immunoglobulin V-set domain [Trinorchestia longiramus]|nr:Immunoglobulin V-set domain [Trinorchestia longiramus]